MRVKINGEWTEVACESESLPVRTLLERLERSTSFSAVAVNREFVPRASHESTIVRSGDEVEILSPRQGG